MMRDPYPAWHPDVAYAEAFGRKPEHRRELTAAILEALPTPDDWETHADLAEVIARFVDGLSWFQAAAYRSAYDLNPPIEEWVAEGTRDQRGELELP